MVLAVLAIAISTWPWGTWAAMIATIAGVAACIRGARRKARSLLAALQRYLEDLCARVSAGIVDPIVTEIREMRTKQDHFAQDAADCRVDRDAIWAQLGGRPPEPIPRNHLTKELPR